MFFLYQYIANIIFDVDFIRDSIGMLLEYYTLRHQQLTGIVQ